jgi:hypothetical protein
MEHLFRGHSVDNKGTYSFLNQVLDSVRSYQASREIQGLFLNTIPYVSMKAL